MAGFCLAWSIVSLVTFLAKDYSSMVALRFILGVTEAPVRISVLTGESQLTDCSFILVLCLSLACSTHAKNLQLGWLFSTPAIWWLVHSLVLSRLVSLQVLIKSMA